MTLFDIGGVYARGSGFQDWIPTLVAVLIFMVLFAATANTQTENGESEINMIEILLSRSHFMPEEIVVNPGVAIVFYNTDTYPHSIYLLDDQFSLQREDVLGGASFGFQVPGSMGPGNYMLGCRFHPSMLANLTVTAP